MASSTHGPPPPWPRPLWLPRIKPASRRRGYLVRFLQPRTLRPTPWPGRRSCSSSCRPCWPLLPARCRRAQRSARGCAARRTPRKPAWPSGASSSWTAAAAAGTARRARVSRALQTASAPGASSATGGRAAADRAPVRVSRGPSASAAAMGAPTAAFASCAPGTISPALATSRSSSPSIRETAEKQVGAGSTGGGDGEEVEEKTEGHLPTWGHSLARNLVYQAGELESVPGHFKLAKHSRSLRVKLHTVSLGKRK